MNSAVQLESNGGYSAVEDISLSTQIPGLSDGDGRRLEKPVPGVLKHEKTDQVSNAKTFYASNELIIKTVTLTYQIHTILVSDCIAYCRKPIYELASLFSKRDFLSYSELTLKGALWRQIDDKIMKYIREFDNTKRNMAHLSSCLILVFNRITELCCTPDNELKMELKVFIDDIQKHVKYHDDALWTKWFSRDSNFEDWMFFLANIFMSGKNFVNEDEEIRIRNAVKYFRKVRYSHYIFCNDKSKKKTAPETNDDDIFTIGDKAKKRKYEENHRVDDDIFKRINVTGNKPGVFIKQSRKRLRRLLK
ncbi:Hypothetical protein CINCED_3A001089 [Cinara cedri]|uniref:Uncharacterized protein n=1 Tax=Cinara cedri TaxID=506608 RepID=A0A5E4MNL6_9HEMI|nr:Hypothetical protein CINCED_3A001089 [Cinara cedri]